MTFSIRPATQFDASSILSLLWEYNESKESRQGPNSPEKVSASWNSICLSIEQGLAFVAVCGPSGVVGSIGGALAEDWWSRSSVVQQRWWYVQPAFREGVEPSISLMRALADRCRSAGVTFRFSDVSGTGRDAAKERLLRGVGLYPMGTVYESGV